MSWTQRMHIKFALKHTIAGLKKKFKNTNLDVRFKGKIL